VEQRLRPTGGNQRAVELAIVVFPLHRLVLLALEHPGLEARKLVIGRDDTALPVDVARRKRFAQCVSLKEIAHRGNLAKIRRGDAGDLEATLALRSDQAFRKKAVENFTQGADAGAVERAQPLQPQLLPRRETTEDDVGANAPI